MERETKQTVTLGYDEVREAMAEYVQKKMFGETDCPSSPTCFAVLDNHARHSDFKLEVIWFTGDVRPTPTKGEE